MRKNLRSAINEMNRTQAHTYQYIQYKPPPSRPDPQKVNTLSTQRPTQWTKPLYLSAQPLAESMDSNTQLTRCTELNWRNANMMIAQADHHSPTVAIDDCIANVEQLLGRQQRSAGMNTHTHSSYTHNISKVHIHTCNTHTYTHACKCTRTRGRRKTSLFRCTGIDNRYAT